ncbi:imidazole glycerol phosphate synthase subunit HisH [Thermanaerovibrio acidaminovorans]|uniref:imidazole glycerol phosphate synthase subunit HisH n=1 Tax=Thermanaerovibrio acidaminovorans TaxID=81462 RepID=UPI00249266FC|nr:imidazole glycerol phosphate synthase subunit HisH [Thermanaerovibrio acidaminovorans]
MIGIVDYGAGNLENLRRALTRIGRDARVLRSPGEAEGLQLLFLPGVGSFGSAMGSLRASGWDRALIGWAEAQRGLIGICLGMQMMMEFSFEDGGHRGLGIFRGTVEPYRGGRRIHMGWDRVEWPQGGPGADTFYFVHRYCARSCPSQAAICGSDGEQFVAAVREGSVMGFQFHPERSGPEGLELLRWAIGEVV